MTKEAAGAKKAEADGEIFLMVCSCWWNQRVLEGSLSQISLINNTIPLCNGLADTNLHKHHTLIIGGQSMFEWKSTILKKCIQGTPKTYPKSKQQIHLDS